MPHFPPNDHSDLPETKVSEEQAYWLGFLAADGSVKNGRALVVHLAGVDHDHLCRLRSFLASEHSISVHDDGSVSLTIYDQQIVGDLYRLGVRSGEERFVPQLPPNLVRHYFRGLFDGDGCITACRAGRNLTPCWRLELTSDRALCEAFAKYVRQQTGSKGCVYFQCKVWRCKVSGQEFPKHLAAWLYQDATVYLPRKQAVFLMMTSGTGVYVDETAYCLRPKDIAQRLGVTDRAVLKHITAGRLLAKRVGRHWWVRIADAEEWYRQFDENQAVA